MLDGALLSIGDTHAAQGDGEVSGTAIETARIRHPGDPGRSARTLHLTGPEFLRRADHGRHSDRAGVTRPMASVQTSLEAARDALRRMIDWLGRERGLDPVQAYLLCSVTVDLRVSEIVDVPNFIVTAHCPLGIFE